MIDIHTHLLPKMDDGSQSMDCTMQMLREAEKSGFNEIITTSHYMEGAYDFSKDERKKIISNLQKIIKREKINIKLYNGAEIYITNNMIELIKKNKAPTLADSRYVLFEIPLNSSILFLDQVLDDLFNNGYVPIIAHPERYRIVKEDPNEAVEWVRKGALLQANYDSINGKYGKEAQKTLVKLLEANAIHFLGTDCHRSNSTYTRIEMNNKEFLKIIDDKKLKELNEINPKKILNNEMIEIDDVVDIKKKFFWSKLLQKK